MNKVLSLLGPDTRGSTDCLVHDCSGANMAEGILDNHGMTAQPVN